MTRGSPLDIEAVGDDSRGQAVATSTGDIIDAREFHLDAATYQYRVETLTEHGVVLTYPFKVAVPFEELVE
jgi:hypothetical protein